MKAFALGIITAAVTAISAQADTMRLVGEQWLGTSATNQARINCRALNLPTNGTITRYWISGTKGFYLSPNANGYMATLAFPNGADGVGAFIPARTTLYLCPDKPVSASYSKIEIEIQY